jgi:hypothetical protein
MKEMKFKCQFCGYTPRTHEQSETGAWYCPRCGKRTTIRLTVPRPRKFSQKSRQSSQISRDQISSKIYSELTKEKTPNFGLKEPYINPPIELIKPKLRKVVRIFFPPRDDD